MIASDTLQRQRMPNAIPNHRPSKARPKRADDSARPNAHARGYCSRSWKAIRALVLLRDIWKCVDCQRVIAEPRHAHVDHIVPRALGGSDSLDNLATRCASCHAKKGYRDGSRTQAGEATSKPLWCASKAKQGIAQQSTRGGYTTPPGGKFLGPAGG